MAWATQGQSEKLRLGKVINNTAAFLGRNLMLLLVFGVLFFVLPALLASLGTYWYWSRLPLIGCGGEGAAEAFMLASVLLPTALNFVGYAVLSRATLDGIKGDRPSVGDCIQAALRYSLPIAGIGFAIYLAVFFAGYAMLRNGLATPSEALAAFAVIIAPFIPWGLGISVAVPVAIQEGLGVRASISRSRALTNGHRWPISSLFLVVIVLFVVRQVAVLSVSTALTSVSALIVVALLDILVWAMIWMVTSIAITVTYIELRRIKEGASTGELAEMFS